ncbi:MAG: NACHT domain-containing protein [Anaerolineae bacterium]|nr:NACHT domain-containing protein [Anaerolineae bacterium]
MPPWPRSASLVGGLGSDLIANQLQAWKDRSEADLATDLQTQAAADPTWRNEIDLVLQKLEAVQVVREAIPAEAQAHLIEALRKEFAALGNLERFEATLSGTGVIVQGDGAIGAQERSIAAQRLQGLAITGDNNVVQFVLRQYQAAPGGPLAEETLRGHIERYLKWVGERYGAIELRGIERQGQQVIQLDLDTVYVPLAAVDFGNARRDIRLDQVLASGHRLVITGGPGSGKTTILQHVAWSLALALLQDRPELAAARLGLPRDNKEAGLPLPVFVPLSAYAQHRRNLPAASPPDTRTLASFISHYLIDRQSTLRLPRDFFARLLHEGQAAILLLDGLDEVPDDDDRAIVREAIQDLVAGKEQLRVVVTCRTVAYKERTVLGSGFREIEVRPLAPGHIDQLVTHAYAAIHPADPDQRQEKCASLLNGIRSLEAERQRRLGDETKPLVTSPLLVRLLLIVQENNRRLPDQRAELYMKGDNPGITCWMKRARQVWQNKESHRELIQYLAFQMHRRGEQQGRDIEENQLKQLLQQSRYAELVPDLIKVTRLRGTLLEERNGVYRFIHLSFQEFLAARYLAEVVRGKTGVEGIARFLEAGPILESWWREPALLVIGYLGKVSLSSAQDLLRRLAGADEEAGSRNANLTHEVQIAAISVAATAFREWSPWQVGEADLYRALSQRLLCLMQDASVRPKQRAGVGIVLARLGDPRVEVLTSAAMEFCYVPAGPFWMGSQDDPDAGENEQPHKLDIPYGYWIGRYPVMNAQFGEFAAAGGYREARYWREAEAAGYWNSDGFKERWDNERRQRPYDRGEPYTLPNHPAVGVTWYEALA